ncbi:quorum-sensing sensor histidine kinase AgrC [Staphylococcus saccharolyticus]|uniref:quorum-sensing sensor histidine kinase AgrC n=1 Tax=Staphylococcus saccharolyticus TaxID=33028 RepID=UPI00102DC727|nr:GHKL domain-containing protein [Staphylococcus saccharolyticus]MBL7574071.1 GHKL domain-containing protein [Staphylococcus saccharolyticus]MBL7585139.1 GHKL domain-containing protein [Staphylococcus saccharolyticus]MBL7639749.1 GHKL domain-containing protein [Staphylococcus saccharolyticus]QRJ68956.1 GHKL domain-containing protein [Staphylococcus saccharolyticus]TAA91195.1 ATP-binding protein [Staphylococcus saccharolyticus]
MDDINLFPFAALQTFLMIWVTKVIINMKFNFRDYLIVLTIVIPSAIMYYLWQSKALIVLVIAITIFFYTKIKLYSILVVLFTTMILYITNFITVYIYLTIQDYIPFKFALQLIDFSCFVVIALIIAYLTQLLFYKLKVSYLSLNKRYLLIITIVLFISFILLYMVSQTDMRGNDTLKLYAILLLAIMVFLSVVILVMSNFTLREMRYKRNVKEIEAYYEYTLRIESINNEMRKFRHDYVNILTTLSDYIREDDMPGLRKYFNEHIVPMKDNLKTRSIKMNGIEKLKVREIKGLITTKILQAQEKKIPISIEVPDEVDRIDMNTIELSRIIGIILDNAIEASESLEDPLIRIAFIDNDVSVTFIVMNKCSDNIPKIHELFEQGFSTKGDNRGLGLSTLKELIDENENVLLDTIIENGFFVQKVEIINKES